MARKIPAGYVVRRPLVLWGEERSIGDVITPTDIRSRARLDTLVRAGRLNEVFEETDKGAVVKTRTGKTDDPEIYDLPTTKTEKKAAPKKEASPDLSDMAPVDEPEKEVAEKYVPAKTDKPAAKKTTKKRAKKKSE